MDQKYIDLYDEYTHTSLGRKRFLVKLAKLAGGVVAANALLPLLDVNYARAAIMPAGDDRIVTETITYRGAEGEVRAYQAKPVGGGKHHAVVVIHENRGLNPHIEDVTRRVAAAGFLAIAPDALSPLGGTPDDSDLARTRMRKLNGASNLTNFIAAVDYLDSHSESTGKVGCVGFCWGGGMANQLAVNAPNLDAAVAYYGRQPTGNDVPKIRAALLLHYGELDRRINAGIADYEAALKANKVDYTIHVYQGVNHAFHNDTAPTRYNEAAAKLSWGRTIEFFNSKLR